MLTGEMAKCQIEDRIRAAERDHAAASIRVDHDGGPITVVRRVGSGLLAAVVGRRKISPTSAGIRIAR